MGSSYPPCRNIWVNSFLDSFEQIPREFPSPVAAFMHYSELIWDDLGSEKSSLISGISYMLKNTLCNYSKTCEIPKCNICKPQKKQFLLQTNKSSKTKTKKNTLINARWDSCKTTAALSSSPYHLHQNHYSNENQKLKTKIYSYSCCKTFHVCQEAVQQSHQGILSVLRLQSDERKVPKVNNINVQ